MFIFAHLFATLERERGTIFTHTPSSIFLLLFYVTPPALSRKGNFLFIFVKILSSISVWANGAFAKTERKANPQTVHSASRSPSMPAYEAQTHENRCQVESCRVVPSRVYVMRIVYTSTVGCASSCVIYLSYLIGDGWVGNCHGWFSS
ncbi:hypothetical protein M6B38_349595 [Iris pallida]|uniref:Uncharacterized protein n=1 Tax=Iris pallida TaxID=29817 RepID=A0AAX6GS53_IRIPA|nr:hypothetical protein M6B38_349595 [Iris pallida]